MSRSVLSVKSFNGAYGAYRLIGATVAAIGASFGVADAFPLRSSFFARQGPSIVQWSYGSGSDKILLVAIVQDTVSTLGVYTYDGSSWTLRSSRALGGQYSGVYVLYPNGVPTLCFMYMDTASGQWARATSTDGVTWSYLALGSSLILGTVGDEICAEGTFNNKIFLSLGFQDNYATTATGVGHVSWDSATDTTAVVNPAKMDMHSQAFCGFKNQYYKVAQNNTDGNPNLSHWFWGFDGSTYQPIVQLPQGGNSAPRLNSYAQPILYDGGDGFLYAIYPTADSGSETPANYGWLCAKIDVTGALAATVTDVSALVFNANFGYGAAGGRGLPYNSVWRVLVEVETSATVPTVHLYQSTRAGVLVGGVAWNYYLWNGPAALVGSGGTPTASGGDATMHLPCVSDGGSDRIWVPSDFDSRLVAPCAPDSGGIDWFAQCFGPLGTETKSLLLYHDENRQIPKASATLSNPGVVQSTVAAGSNGQSLPQSTINVLDTTGFPRPTVDQSTTVAVGSNGVDVSTFAGAGVLNVAATAGFPASGTLYVETASAGLAEITFTGTSGGNQFTGCTTLHGYSGVLATGGAVRYVRTPLKVLVQTSAHSTTIAAGSNGQSLPQSTINVASTAGFASSGYLKVTTGAGSFVVKYAGVSGGNQFTGCVYGAGVMATGGAVVELQSVVYLGLGIGGTSFTNCSTGGSGAMATGGLVISGPATPPTLNANNIQLDGATCDGNTDFPTTYKGRWEAQVDGLSTNQVSRITPAVQ